MASKIKVILAGSIGDNVELLQKKLKALQNSKAGPFDVCFSVGASQLPDDLSTLDLPFPVYLQSFQGKLPENSDGESLVNLATNLHYLRGDAATSGSKVQFHHLTFPNQEHPLVVATCSSSLRLPPNYENDNHQYPPCDLFLTSDWPQGMEDVLNLDTEPLSFDVAQAALHIQPRYHVSPSSVHFYASPPYALPDAESVGRFLAIPPVLATAKPTSGRTKFLHALGLVPAAAQPPAAAVASLLPCPFLSNRGATTGPAVARSPAPNMNAGGGPPPSSNFRFDSTGGGGGRRRNRDEDDGPFQPDPPEGSDLKTLFLYGLFRDVTGQLQQPDAGKTLISNALSIYPIQDIRYPVAGARSSGFCFLEFASQEVAKQCLMECQGRVEVSLGGGATVPLTLKWATPNHAGDGPSAKRARHDPAHFVTQAEAANSSTLYFHPPKGVEMGSDFGEGLAKYLQTTLENALNDDDGKTTESGDGESSKERVTAETEPALKVEYRNIKEGAYGFLEFASHAAATMGLAAVTSSTDGGLVEAKEGVSSDHPSQAFAGTTLRWAKGAPSKKTERQEILEALGGMERHYYAKDSRTDCWFCLASPTCETHLITGVYQRWYATMPKGPIHPGHMLLVPVNHTRRGVWTLTGEEREEYTSLVQQLQDHASKEYDCDLFVFERAMETKGGYHSHVNCVPIPRTDQALPMTLEATMRAHAQASGFALRRIQSDLDTAAMLVDPSPDAQYFYVELRTATSTSRYIYQEQQDGPPGTNAARTVVPLQFAREVLAAVLGNPRLAHWKSCVVDKDQETQLAKDFRESYGRFTHEAQGNE
eukprot:Nitzschia sp. Nitz4//NODE_444_length_18484_cov_71.934560//14373//16829//NITZ4_additional_000059-RA//1//CDS//3329531902//3759//frame0